MNKKVIIISLVVVAVAIGGYFIFARQGSAPITDQVRQPGQTYTDPDSFKPSFLQCSPSELKMPGTDADPNTLVITIFGLENGKCHYAEKTVDKNGITLQLPQGGFGVIDCKTPMKLINADFFENDMFGPKATSYCTAISQ